MDFKTERSLPKSEDDPAGKAVCSTHSLKIPNHSASVDCRGRFFASDEAGLQLLLQSVGVAAGEPAMFLCHIIARHM
jgi:hypothetical protein